MARKLAQQRPADRRPKTGRHLFNTLRAILTINDISNYLQYQLVKIKAYTTNNNLKPGNYVVQHQRNRGY